jgi:hypothetical protein
MRTANPIVKPMLPKRSYTVGSIIINSFFSIFKLEALTMFTAFIARFVVIKRLDYYVKYDMDLDKKRGLLPGNPPHL